ncbi:MAG TPA: 1-deoxy-D-xylulose-5-phosphate reductoisomerase, partial [Desulfobulbus sp.]|nr:1-deoxy-D-xylulose-5-phosphate reductoisomerase [Desulfobulbus sp.]
LGLSRLSLSRCGNLSFEKPDYDRFPALRLAFTALEQGGVKPAMLNAANEVAVDAFLDGHIGFTDIAAVVGATLNGAAPEEDSDLAAILRADRIARQRAGEEILRRPRPQS